LGPQVFRKICEGKGYSRHKPFCLKGIKSSSRVLLLQGGPIQQGSGCLSTELEVPLQLCLSTVCSDRKGIEKAGGTECSSSISQSSLAKSGMVSKASATISKNLILIPNLPNLLLNPAGEVHPLPKSVFKADSMDIIRQRLAAERISKESSDLSIHSRRKGTQSHYKSAWGQWLAGVLKNRLISLIAL